MYVDFERHRYWFSLRLWCLQSFDNGIPPILQKNIFLKKGLYYLVYYIWFIAFTESYYFLCVKKTLEQIYRNKRLFIRKLFVMAYLSVQKILLYNKRLK